MLIIILQIAAALLLPALLVKIAKHLRIQGWLSPIVLCYLAGILLGNIRSLELNDEVSRQISEIAVPLAIPLLLFSTHIKAWVKYAGSTFLSFIFTIIGVLLSSTIGILLFANQVEEVAALGGMMVGVYTGGTPNLAAIGLALKANEETIVLLNASDVICGGIYLIFLTSIAQRMLLLFLPAFKKSRHGSSSEEFFLQHLFSRLKFSTKIKSLATSIGLAVLIVGISIGANLLFYDEIDIAFLILSLTTLSIAASSFRAVRKHKSAYEAGQYLLLIFSVAIGMMSDFSNLMNASSSIFFFTATVMFMAILIHFALSAIFRIDADTVLVTSTAAIFGPVFVGQVAVAIQNRDLIFSGIMTGLIGFAIGNYLGIAYAWLVGSLLGNYPDFFNGFGI